MASETNDPNETIADIVAEIRAANQGLPIDCESINPLAGDWLSVADRIEAAAKRAYNDIDKAMCGIEDASHFDIDDVRKAMEKTIGDYYE